MDLLESNASRLKFEAYIDELVSVIGHCTGLLLPGERKSVEPMAALVSTARTAPKTTVFITFCCHRPVVG